MQLCESCHMSLADLLIQIQFVIPQLAFLLAPAGAERRKWILVQGITDHHYILRYMHIDG